jgi:hypothetical protein
MMVRTGGMDSCAAEEELAASASAAIQLPGDSGIVDDEIDFDEQS